MSKFWRQLFCRHKEYHLALEEEPFSSPIGVYVYQVCNRCGKVIGVHFMTYGEYFGYDPNHK